MAADNTFGAVSDEELMQLIAQLSSGATQEELNAAGLGSGPPTVDGYNKPFSPDSMKLGSDRKSLYDTAANISPSAAFTHISKSRSRNKKQMAKRRAFNAAQAAGIKQYMAQREARMELAKKELGRRKLRTQINGSFNDPAMKGLYDQIEQSNLQGRLGDVVQQYQGILRNNVFDQASRGLTGSSSDVEMRGDVGQAQNAAAIQAATQAQQFRMGVQNQNEQQRRSLIDAVDSDNPVQGAQFDNQIQGIVNQTRNLAGQQANAATSSQINQFGNNMQSQALGSLLSNLGNLYTINQTGTRR